MSAEERVLSGRLQAEVEELGRAADELGACYSALAQDIERFRAFLEAVS